MHAEFVAGIESRLDAIATRARSAVRDERYSATILCLIEKVRDEFRRGASSPLSLSMAAWTCRNLLELRVQVAWILRSPANAKTFWEDAWIDGLQMYSAFRTHGHILSAKLSGYLEDAGLQDAVRDDFATPLNRTIESLERQIADEGITRRPFTTVESMAKELGMYAEFAPLFKITSKLVHPTAHSILVAADWLENKEDPRPMLVDLCFTYTVEIISIIRNFPLDSESGLTSFRDDA